MADLADRLAALGFNVFFPSDDAPKRTRWLSHAVREFQVYSSMPRTAQERPGPAHTRWLDRLQPIANAYVYVGPIDGDPTGAAFLACLARWEQELYRCPVVIDVFYEDNMGALQHVGHDTAPLLGNYWRYDDPRLVLFHGGNSKQRSRLSVRVCDLTGHFRPAHNPAPDKMEKAGGIARYGSWQGGVVRGGSDADEILPETLIGSPWGTIASAETKSTFRVLRTIAEVEALGRFDGINTYDDAIASFGSCHWALAPANGQNPGSTIAGELPPYLSYWAGHAPADANAKLFKPFGIVTKPAWPAGQPGPKKPSWPSTRNYVGRVDWAPFDTGPDDPGKKLYAELEWMRTLHWTWRWLALSRYVDSFRRRQWDLGRTRIRDVLAFEIDPSDRPGKPAGSKKVRLDRMFTSELAVALLVRCHVRWAAFLDQKRFTGPSLRLALALANLPADVSKWTEADQKTLIEAVIAACAFTGLTADEKKALLKKKLDELPDHRTPLATRPATTNNIYASCRKIADWPIANEFRWHYVKNPPATKYALLKAVCDPLSKVPGSFKLDVSNLPPTPTP